MGLLTNQRLTSTVNRIHPAQCELDWADKKPLSELKSFFNIMLSASSSFLSSLILSGAGINIAAGDNWKFRSFRSCLTYLPTIDLPTCQVFWNISCRTISTSC